MGTPRIGWTAMVLLGLGGTVTAAGEPPAAPDRVEVLNTKTLWRVHVTWRMPAMGTARDWKEPAVNMDSAYPQHWGRWIRDDFSEPTPLPEESWAKADFDDSGWPRRTVPLLGRYGYEGRGCVALVCLRGRFGVADAAKAGPLRLKLACRGGVVVYVNGVEVARRHLPAGKVTLLTLADDYERSVYVSPKTDAALSAVRWGRSRIPADLQDAYERRIRQASIDIPAKLLRKGTNVLAVELHRTATPEGIPNLDRSDWSSAGLAEISLLAEPGAAAVPNVGPTGGVRVWNADPFLRVGAETDHGDAFEELGPITLFAPRNGVASGQVVVQSPEGVKGLSAALVTPDGRPVSPALGVVRYGQVGGSFVGLFDRPVAPQAPEAPKETKEPKEQQVGRCLQPIWVTATVPADAKAGRWHWLLQIRGLPERVTVPVTVEVYDWRAPDAPQRQSWVDLLQSPESVARHYQVPLWSQRHFELLEASLALTGRMGNHVVTISAVGKTVYGDDPVLIFRRDDSAPTGWAPEFKHLRRYLAMCAKHGPAPRIVCVQVWHYGLYYKGAGRDGTKRGYTGTYPIREKTVPIHELQGEAVAPAEMPIYGQRGTEELWKRIFAELRRILKDLSWRDTRILLGTCGDARPSEITVEFFKKIAPDVPWRVATHGSSVGRWGMTDPERTQSNGMVVGYGNLVRRNIWRRGHAMHCPASVIARDVIHPNPFDYFGVQGLAAVAALYSGFCWQGLDFWAIGDGRGRGGVLAKYVGFGNIIPHRPMAITVPGPDGAVPTVQFEMMREGIQAAEAMLFMRRALADEALRARAGPELAKRCHTAVQGLVDTLESGRRVYPHGVADVRRLTRRVYAAASELAGVVVAKQ